MRIYPPEGSGEWELFDIQRDPTEKHDLAAKHPKIVEELAADCDAYAASSGVFVLDRDMGYGRYRE